MSQILHSIHSEASAPHLQSLKRLYMEMDGAYTEAASAHGFECPGCEDNCCETEFYHHTLIEYLYIKEGFEALPESVRQTAGEKAASACARRAAATGGRPVRVMCPLNANGRCLVYAHRPMICRLHGVPSTFRHPARGLIRSPGCAAFDRCCGDGVSVAPRLDRTLFYRKMSELEQQLRNATDVGERIRKTVAEMVVSFPATPPETADPFE